MKKLFLVLFVLGCGPNGGDDPDGGAGGDGGLDGTLEISPASATLAVVDGAAAEQPYTVTLRHPDDTTTDVTAEAGYFLDDTRLGTFQGQTLVASGVAGGEGTVTATYGGLQVIAEVTVTVQNTRVIDPAPANAADLFDAAIEDANRAPAIVYPSNATMVPPNLGDFEVHWTETAGSDLFEVRMAGDHVDLRLYLTGTPNAGNWAAFLPAEWAVAGTSHAGDDLTVVVRGMSTAAPDFKGTSAPIEVTLTEEAVEGGIYYWAAASTNNAPTGIYRHDMSRPGEVAEQFYTTAEAPENRCVACHVLSRDGTKMGITYNGGNGSASMIDVGTRTEMIPLDTQYWNFATFTPDATRLLTVHQGAATLRDPDTGAAVGPAPALGTYISHPDFSPAGAAVTFVDVASPGNDWTFTGGRLMIANFDAAADTFGTPTQLHASAQNIFYPSFSPDGEWIVFNQSDEDAYDDASAELWVMKTDGSVGPLKLEIPNAGPGLTNSWPRWAPFEQTWKQGTEEAEPLLWFTFSSKRNFGVRLVNANPALGRPQIWMAPFFPQRAQNGMEASAPAFRLPFQNLESNNHIAQWTEQVIPIE